MHSRAASSPNPSPPPHCHPGLDPGSREAGQGGASGPRIKSGRQSGEADVDARNSPGMTVGNSANPGPGYPRWVPALIGTISPVTSSAPVTSQTMASATSSATILRLSGAAATKPDSTFS